MVRKPVVLFLCSGNSCRSQMAEALLRHRAGDRFEIHSAGLEPRPIHPLTLRVLQEKGIDTAGLHAKSLDRYLGRLPVRHLIIVCGAAASHCPTIWPGAGGMNRQVWPFEDPAALDGTEAHRLEKFREVRDQIDRSLEQWLATVVEETPA